MRIEVAISDLRTGDHTFSNFPRTARAWFTKDFRRWGATILDVEGDFVKVKRHHPRAKPEWLPKKNIQSAWRFTE